MKFIDYMKKVSESSATKRNVTGPYAKMMYPPSHGTTYRLQYSPDSLGINYGKKRKKKNLS